MKKAVICGAGRQGYALGLGLEKLGYKIDIVEKDGINIERFVKCHHGAGVYTDINDLDGTPDIVISCLPYFENEQVATFCVNHGLRYCDLGGSVPVSTAINELALEKAKAPVMTDLGLAPGWVNLVAEECVKLLPGTTSVEMRVGGLPATPVKNPFKYQVTWSIDGLVNEYLDNCLILSGEQEVILSGMSGLQNVIVNDLELEAFYTSGAMAYSLESMKSQGVRDCSYKTLRWRGHRDLVMWVYGQMGADVLKSVLSKCDEGVQDFVILDVIASNSSLSVRKTRRIEASRNLTAMQRSTAFALASAADVIATGAVDGLAVVSYDKLPLQPFNSNLDHLLLF